MPADATPKILLTGATGFTGGSILTALLDSSHPSIKSNSITVLLRDEDGDRAALLISTYGARVNPVIYNGLDDLETTMQEPYAQRTTELGVIDTGLELGFKTLVIMSPIIYGMGTGLFNRFSIHTQVMQAMLGIGSAVVVGFGVGVWDHVHVQDLAELYRLVVLEILEEGGEALPVGKRGVIFSANGRHSWLEYSQLIADACCERGLLVDRGVTRLTLEEAAEMRLPRLGFSSGVFDKEKLQSAADGFCSNEMTVASVARGLGWNPVRGRDAWEQSFRDDVEAIQER